MSRFDLEVSYAQLAVFDARLENPFNDWSDAHVAQGFSWRPGSVSFATLESAGGISVAVTRSAGNASPDERVERAIVVPFTVPDHGDVEVATITDSVPLHLPPGDYELTFCHGRSSTGAMWATLNLAPAAVPVTARIVVADPGMRPLAGLVLTAEPAWP